MLYKLLFCLSYITSSSTHIYLHCDPHEEGRLESLDWTTQTDKELKVVSSQMKCIHLIVRKIHINPKHFVNKMPILAFMQDALA